MSAWVKHIQCITLHHSAVITRQNRFIKTQTTAVIQVLNADFMSDDSAILNSLILMLK